MGDMNKWISDLTENYDKMVATLKEMNVMYKKEIVKLQKENKELREKLNMDEVSEKNIVEVFNCQFCKSGFVNYKKQRCENCIKSDKDILELIEFSDGSRAA